MMSGLKKLFTAACLSGLVVHASACAGDPGDPDDHGGVDAGPDDPSGDQADQAGVDVTSKAVAPGRFAGRFSSPTIVRVGDTYHAYFAKQTIQLGTRTRTFHVPHAALRGGAWSAPREVLPHLGRGAKADGPVWAPAVARIGAHRWMLYYTAQVAPTAAHPSSEKKCIWRAHATSATGPFVDDYPGPLVCQGGTLWSIDPYVVRDARGNWNLAARIDLGGGINSIQIRRLGPAGGHFAPGSSWHLLARNYQGSWDQHVMENAGVVRLRPPDGQPAHWFVFYSARHWDDDTYAIGYADCGENIFGLASPGCRKKTPTRAWLATSSARSLWGPGTPTFYTDGAGHTMMSIQAWHYRGGVAAGSPNRARNRREGQIMKTYRIRIDDDYRPHVALERTDS